ncbi:MAG: hypothetical protein KAG43_08525 [Candidatus Marithrix sp.]|nr:hypothetical protein [Candidatus Marithrix sp.]
MKKIFIALVLSTIVSVVNAKVEVDFSAAKFQLNDDNTVVFDGVRVDGFGFSIKNDALKLRFKFDLDSLSFKLDTSDVVSYKGIGISNGQCMVNDAPVTSVTTNEEGQEVESKQPFYTANVKTSYKVGSYKEGREDVTVAAGDLIEAGGNSYRFTTSTDNPFVAEFDLLPHQIMSWNIDGLRNGISYQITGPEVQDENGETKSGDVITSGELNEGGKKLLGPIKIVEAGIYKLKVSIVPEQAPTTFTLKSFNGNSKVLKKIVNNTRLGEVLEENTSDCSKFQVSLNRDEVLTVPATSGDNNLTVKLVNNMSRVIAQVGGSNDLVYKETDRNNDYYLFIYSDTADKAVYSGKISIILEKPEEVVEE